MQIGPKSELRGIRLGDVVNLAGSLAAIFVLPITYWVLTEVVALKVAVARIEGANSVSEQTYVPEPRQPAPQPNTAKAALAAVVPQRVELPGGKK